MAVSDKESQQNIQSLVSQGVPMSYVESIVGTEGFGSKINPTEASTILQRYQANPQDVYSASNIQSADQSPSSRPYDLTGLYNNLYSELGVGAKEEQFNTAYQNLLTAQQTAEEQQLALKGGLASTNVIRGRQAEAGEQASLKISALGRTAQVAENALNAARQNLQTRFELGKGELDFYTNLIVSNPTAGITYGDTLDSVSTKLKVSQENQLLQELKIQYPKLASKIKVGMDFDTAIEQIGKGLTKSDLQDTYKQIFGTSGNGLSSKELTSKIEDYYKSELEDKKRKTALEIEAAQLEIAKSKKNLSADSTPLSLEGIDWTSSITDTLNSSLNYLNWGAYNL